MGYPDPEVTREPGRHTASLRVEKLFPCTREGPARRVDAAVGRQKCEDAREVSLWS